MAIRPFLALGLVAVSTTSCFIARTADNEPLTYRAVESLVPGKTTASDVVATLGAPNDVVQLGKRSAYLYQYSVTKNAGLWLLLVGFFNQDARHDRVWVFFDENNVLSHVGSSLGAHRASYAMPWSSLHDADDRRAEDQARRTEEANSGGGK